MNPAAGPAPPDRGRLRRPAHGRRGPAPSATAGTGAGGAGADALRRLLAAPRTPPPADLAARAMAQGRRRLGRRRLRYAVLWVLLAAAIATALAYWPAPHPLQVAPPLGDW